MKVERRVLRWGTVYGASSNGHADSEGKYLEYLHPIADLQVMLPYILPKLTKHITSDHLHLSHWLSQSNTSSALSRARLEIIWLGAM